MEGSGVLILRGIVAIVIAIVAFVYPGITIAAMVVIFGAYAIVDGVINLTLAFTRTGAENRWAYVLRGAVGIAAGVLTFLWPGVTGFALVMFIGAWAVVTGVLELAAAMGLRRTFRGEWMLVLSGIVSVLFGFFVFLYPFSGAVGIAWIFGAYALVAGIILISLGARLRRNPVTA